MNYSQPATPVTHRNARYLLIDEAAQIARTSPSTVRYWIQVGKLKSTRPGRRRLILESDLMSFLSGEEQ
jgi:excisionase family DNA binding protein